MKIFVTKYALTAGIQEREAMIVKEGMAKLDGKYVDYVYKPQWHLTKHEAILQAEKMRLKKIESLKRQLGKLLNLKFDS